MLLLAKFLVLTVKSKEVYNYKLFKKEQKK